MKVSTILATKGNKLITIAPEQSIREAVALLAQHNIGALIVLNEAGALAGILSERDIARQLNQQDAGSTNTKRDDGRSHYLPATRRFNVGGTQHD